MRWVSPRAIKENLNPPAHYEYAWNQPDAVDEREEPRTEAGNGAVA
jgi:1-pyrroline-5-carboxylate dehydrogenase